MWQLCVHCWQVLLNEMHRCKLQSKYFWLHVQYIYIYMNGALTWIWIYQNKALNISPSNHHFIIFFPFSCFSALEHDRLINQYNINKYTATIVWSFYKIRLCNGWNSPLKNNIACNISGGYLTLMCIKLEKIELDLALLRRVSIPNCTQCCPSALFTASVC